MKYDSEDWKNICRTVSDLCFLIFPFIRKKAVRSALVSNLFESAAETYFLKKGIPVRASKNDQEPDLFFIDEQLSCEIKVTGVDDCVVNKPVIWLGGRYSKRNSDYIFITWNYKVTKTLFENGTRQKMSFVVFKTEIGKDDWKELSNSKNYYGLGLKSTLFQDRKYHTLVGNFTNGKFLLDDFTENFIDA